MNIIKFFIFILITEAASFRVRRSSDIRTSSARRSSARRLNYQMRKNYFRMIKPLYYSDNLFY